jgi:hypothetical protein
MKHGKSMSVKDTIGIVIATLLVMLLALNAGCSTGGTDIKLRGMSLGAVTVDGKPVEGLPSQKVDLLLEVSAREISVGYTANSTILTLNPSGATLEISPSGIVMNGIKPEQVKIEWAVSK